VLAAAAVLAGARPIAAIAERAADAPQPVRTALGTRRDPLTGHWVWAVPSETTIRRTLAWLHRHDALDRRGLETLDAAALEELLAFANGIAAETCTRAGADPPWRR
jgi:fructokinase